MPVEVESRVLGGKPFRLGEWLVEPSLNRISRDGNSIQLELKWMDVLVCLAERAGEVVSRIEIIDRVWATEFITDNTLTHTIAELRNNLGDDARSPSFIETIRGRGYRLIASVKPAISDEALRSRVAKFPVPARPFSEDAASPYPGLAAFTEDDAEFFFGREDEVAKMWRRLTSRRLLAVIGPSGVGKSSFLRAGVIPASPDGWRVAICQPGEAPFTALARALVPEFAGDVDAMAQLVDIRSGDRAVAMVSRWRERHQQALLIVDQFEELFTLNAEEEQVLFADLLGRLVTDWDVHVLLSMRDDFLYRCNAHEPLRPIFDALMPLEQPHAEALRRALVEPAGRLGFSLEDDRLPEEMIAEVEGERGALPLLAFAVARLWDERDDARRKLTRQAYADIGGVGGALGQHAETVLKAIGDDRFPIVRELFRNLVTAEGTHAVREWDELLTVFPDAQRGAAVETLHRLVDARLLTSFEEEAVEGKGRRRVEVVHESLLTAWPRLVRWQTQDEDALQLRDQLRQAARTWEERGREVDLLWTGSAYREFELWWERYPGGLSETEEAFALASKAHALRRKRRRRMAASAALVLAVMLALVFGALWRQSRLETRRAEAQKLVALGQLELEGYPTATLAYSRASLELTDTPEARRLALESLWRGPPASLIAPEVSGDYWTVQFSPDGRWLAASNFGEDVLVYPSTGAAPVVLDGHETVGGPRPIIFDRSGSYVATGGWFGTDTLTRIWSLPEGRLLRALDLDDHGWYFPSSFAGDEFITVRPEQDGGTGIEFLAWPPSEGEPRNLGVRMPVVPGRADITLDWSIDPTGDWVAEIRGNQVFVIPIDELAGGPGQLVATHGERVHNANFTIDGQHFVTEDRSGEFRVWSIGGRHQEPVHVLEAAAETGFDFFGDFDSYTSNSAHGSLIARKSEGEKTAYVWDLKGPPDAQPMMLRREDAGFVKCLAFHPDDHWLAIANGGSLSLWPLNWPWSRVLGGIETAPIYDLEFTPGGERLLAAAGDGVSIWPLRSGQGQSRRPGARRTCYALAVDPAGQNFVRFYPGGEVVLEPLSGEPDDGPRVLFGSDERQVAAAALTFDPTGRKVVAGAQWAADTSPALRITDLDTGEVRSFPLRSPSSQETPHGDWLRDLRFAPDGTLYSGGFGGVRRWDTSTGEFEWILQAHPQSHTRIEIDRDGGWLLALWWISETASELRLIDLTDDAAREITSHGRSLTASTLEESGEMIVTGDADGVIRVSRVADGEPHLLIGHEGAIDVVVVSTDRRWIASGAGDEIRLWPMPDLSKPPLHTLPRSQLIAKLETLTNVRVVRDEESATGWKLTHDPFPGWETVPTW